MTNIANSAFPFQSELVGQDRQCPFLCYSIKLISGPSLNVLSCYDSINENLQIHHLIFYACLVIQQSAEGEAPIINMSEGEVVWNLQVHILSTRCLHLCTSSPKCMHACLGTEQSYSSSVRCTAFPFPSECASTQQSQFQAGNVSLWGCIWAPVSDSGLWESAYFCMSWIPTWREMFSVKHSATRQTTHPPFTQ